MYSSSPTLVKDGRITSANYAFPRKSSKFSPTLSKRTAPDPPHNLGYAPQLVSSLLEMPDELSDLLGAMDLCAVVAWHSERDGLVDGGTKKIGLDLC